MKAGRSPRHLVGSPARGRAAAYPAAKIDRDLQSALAASDTPLSAYELAYRLRAKHRPVTVMSIYRALARLCQEGHVERVEMTSRYRLRDIRHSLLMTCTACGRTAPIDASAQHAALQELVSHQEFAVTKIAIEAAGLCRECQVNGGG